MNILNKKSSLANLLASWKVQEIKNSDFNKLPKHYKTMTYEDWCKYYFSLPKKLILQFLHQHGLRLDYVL